MQTTQFVFQDGQHVGFGHHNDVNSCHVLVWRLTVLRVWVMTNHSCPSVSSNKEQVKKLSVLSSDRTSRKMLLNLVRKWKNFDKLGFFTRVFSGLSQMPHWCASIMSSCKTYSSFPTFKLRPDAGNVATTKSCKNPDECM